MLRRLVLALACIMLALASTALLVERLAPASPAAAAVSTVLPSAEVHAQAAQRATSAHDWKAARRETQAELAVSPVLNDCWLRLAELDVAENGRLGPAGIEALSHAYDAEPYDLSPAHDRRRFVAQHMVELPANLHAQVEIESSSLPY